MLKTVYCTLIGIMFLTYVCAQQIIPLPQKMTTVNGSFIINAEMSIGADSGMLNEAIFLQQHIEAYSGNRLPVTKQSSSQNKITLRKEKLMSGEGAYKLDITPSAITISANDAKGAFYGCISLLQLMPVPVRSANAQATVVTIPAMKITDFPRFKWRGLMLDVSRTFMPVDYVKKIITRMAFYKMNTLHMHLTDDQGWRIPIKTYPLLNKKSASFDTAYHEPREYQGYYSQKDISDLVAYASALHIEIVPEIESPGHSQAPLFAYPELSCNGNIQPIFPYFSGEGVTDAVFCVGNPGSQQFFKSVISETAKMFPSPYMHLGGDEVPRTSWEKCKKCQAIVKSARLDNTGELQGYFMQHLHDEVISDGKRPIAWDEILEDNKHLSKDWVVMSWRGSKPGLEAAAKGFDVIMTPTSHMYFDYSYETINTKKVFEFDPFEGVEADSVTKRILGIQANFWSHIDRTQSKIDYQLFPRLLALAERAWSSASNRDYENFRKRKIYHRKWLNFMDVKYYSGDF